MNVPEISLSIISNSVYKNIAINYYKGDDNKFYGISNQSPRFCLAKPDLDDLKQHCKECVDFYYKSQAEALNRT